MHPLYFFMDPYLIWFYRLTPWAGVNFILGTLAVAALALMLGEFTSWGAARLVRRHLEEVTEEVKKYHELSLKALATGDRPAYEAANKVANEFYGKSFVMQMTLSATFFWPVFLVLGWMQCRFLEVEFPIPGTTWSLGYIGAFVLIYAAAYFVAKQGKRRLKFFRRPHPNPGFNLPEPVN